MVLDITLPKGERLTLPIEKRQRAALFITLGNLRVGDSLLPHRHLGVLSDDEEWVEIEALLESRFLLITGTPLREPIASYGPFVMNSPEEIHIAISDYQSGKFDR